MKGFTPIGHDDRLSIVDHLDELRSRLFVCGGVLLVVFCICYTQNGALIDALNRALPSQSSVAAHGGLGAEPKQAVSEERAFQNLSAGASALASSLAGAHGIPPSAIQALHQMSAGAAEAAKALPKSTSNQEKPITLGVGESFTTTLMVVGYFTLLFASR